MKTFGRPTWMAVLFAACASTANNGNPDARASDAANPDAAPSRNEACGLAPSVVIVAPQPAGWPNECHPTELGPSLVAQPTARSGEPVPENGPVVVEFANSMLATFNGLPCLWCGYAQPRPLTSGDYRGCTTYYACSDGGLNCRATLQIVGNPREWRLSAGCPGYSNSVYWTLGPADAAPYAPCTRNCGVRRCGADGCGGTCGTCAVREICSYGVCSDPSSGGSNSCPASCRNLRRPSNCCRPPFCAGDCSRSSCCH